MHVEQPTRRALATAALIAMAAVQEGATRAADHAVQENVVAADAQAAPEVSSAHTARVVWERDERGRRTPHGATVSADGICTTVVDAAAARQPRVESCVRERINGMPIGAPMDEASQKLSDYITHVVATYAEDARFMLEKIRMTPSELGMAGDAEAPADRTRRAVAGLKEYADDVLDTFHVMVRDDVVGEQPSREEISNTIKAAILVMIEARAAQHIIENEMIAAEPLFKEELRDLQAIVDRAKDLLLSIAPDCAAKRSLAHLIRTTQTTMQTVTADIAAHIADEIERDSDATCTEEQ